MPRVFALLIVAVLALVEACGGGDNGPSPTNSASPTALAETPTPTAVPTPTRRPAGSAEPPPQGPWRLIIREFTATEDVIWRVNPVDPLVKEELARIPHREGYGLKPALSPDGRMLAYLSLPEFAQSVQSSQAEAYVMDLETKESVKLADGVDMTYTPIWSPDGRLLYFRRLAGAEFLSADISILRVRVPREGDPTPSPTPTQPPDATPSEFTPTPTPDPIQTVLIDSIARVLSFTPIGFSDDNRSVYFVQVQGGTGGATLVGLYAPATSESIAVVERFAADAQLSADEENRRRIEEAIASGQPTPEVTVTPQPTPTPDSRFVVELSEQLAFDYELSPDMRRVSYLNQEFSDTGEILNRAFVADLIEASVAPLPAHGLSAGHHLRPVWYPDSARLTIGVLPSDGGRGLLALVSPDGTQVSYLAQPDSGFDEPRSWSPDGTWLVVAHSSGTSLANRGNAALELVAMTGHRALVINGADNVTEDSVLGWVNIEAPAPTPLP